MLKFRTPRATALALPALLLAVACADQDPAGEQTSDKTEAIDQSPAPSASNADQKVRRGHGDKRMGGKRMRHGQRGPERLLHAALHDLDLSDAQRKTLTDLQNSEQRPEPGANARESIHSLLVQGWKTGTIDQQAIDDALSGMETQHARRVAEHVRIINQLHETLTPEQRKALVAKLQERWSERPERPRGDKRLGRPRGDFSMGMLRGLDLTDSQRTQLEALRPSEKPALAADDFEQHRKQRAALLEAFEQDSFDAAKFIDQSAKGGRLREGILKRVEFVKQASKVLTEEQRTQLVQRLSEGQRFGFKGRPHVRPGGSTL